MEKLEEPSSRRRVDRKRGLKGVVLISGNIGERWEREKRGDWMEKATATKFVVIDRRHCPPPLFVGSRVVDKGCDSRFVALSLEDSWRNGGGFFVRVMVHRSL